MDKHGRISEFGSEADDVIIAEISIDQLYKKEFEKKYEKVDSSNILDPSLQEKLLQGSWAETPINPNVLAKRTLATAYHKFMFSSNDRDMGHKLLRSLTTFTEQSTSKLLKEYILFEIHRCHAMGYVKAMQYTHALKHLNQAINDAPRFAPPTPPNSNSNREATEEKDQEGPTAADVTAPAATADFYPPGFADVLVLMTECYSALGRREDALHSARLAVNLAHERMENQGQSEDYLAFLQEHEALFAISHGIVLDSPSSLILAYCTLAVELEKSGMGHLSVEWYTRAYSIAKQYNPAEEDILHELLKLIDFSESLANIGHGRRSPNSGGKKGHKKSPATSSSPSRVRPEVIHQPKRVAAAHHHHHYGEEDDEGEGEEEEGDDEDMELHQLLLDEDEEENRMIAAYHQRALSSPPNMGTSAATAAMRLHGTPSSTAGHGGLGGGEKTRPRSAYPRLTFEDGIGGGINDDLAANYSAPAVEYSASRRPFSASRPTATAASAAPVPAALQQQQQQQQYYHTSVDATNGNGNSSNGNGQQQQQHHRPKSAFSKLGESYISPGMQPTISNNGHPVRPPNTLPPPVAAMTAKSSSRNSYGGIATGPAADNAGDEGGYYPYTAEADDNDDGRYYTTNNQQPSALAVVPNLAYYPIGTIAAAATHQNNNNNNNNFAMNTPSSFNTNPYSFTNYNTNPNYHPQQAEMSQPMTGGGYQLNNYTYPPSSAATGIAGYPLHSSNYPIENNTYPPSANYDLNNYYDNNDYPLTSVANNDDQPPPFTSYLEGATGRPLSAAAANTSTKDKNKAAAASRMPHSIILLPPTNNVATMPFYTTAGNRPLSAAAATSATITPRGMMNNSNSKKKPTASATRVPNNDAEDGTATAEDDKLASILANYPFGFHTMPPASAKKGLGGKDPWLHILRLTAPPTSTTAKARPSSSTPMSSNNTSHNNSRNNASYNEEDDKVNNAKKKNMLLTKVNKTALSKALLSNNNENKLLESKSMKALPADKSGNNNNNKPSLRNSKSAGALSSAAPAAATVTAAANHAALLTNPLLTIPEDSKAHYKRLSNLYLPYFKGLKVEARYQVKRLGAHRAGWSLGRIMKANFLTATYDIEFENGDKEYDIFVDDIRIPEHDSKVSLYQATHKPVATINKADSAGGGKGSGGAGINPLHLDDPPEPSRIMRGKHLEEMHAHMLKLLANINSRSQIRKIERMTVKNQAAQKFQALIRGALYRKRFPKIRQQLAKEKELRQKMKELMKREEELAHQISQQQQQQPPIQPQIAAASPAIPAAAAAPVAAPMPAPAPAPVIVMPPVKEIVHEAVEQMNDQFHSLKQEIELAMKKTTQQQQELMKIAARAVNSNNNNAHSAAVSTSTPTSASIASKEEEATKQQQLKQIQEAQQKQQKEQELLLQAQQQKHFLLLQEIQQNLVTVRQDQGQSRLKEEARLANLTSEFNALRGVLDNQREEMKRLQLEEDKKRSNLEIQLKDTFLQQQQEAISLALQQAALAAAQQTVSAKEMSATDKQPIHQADNNSSVPADIQASEVQNQQQKQQQEQQQKLQREQQQQLQLRQEYQAQLQLYQSQQQQLVQLQQQLSELLEQQQVIQQQQQMQLQQQQQHQQQQQQMLMQSAMQHQQQQQPVNAGGHPGQPSGTAGGGIATNNPSFFDMRLDDFWHSISSMEFAPAGLPLAAAGLTTIGGGGLISPVPDDSTHQQQQQQQQHGGLIEPGTIWYQQVNGRVVPVMMVPLINNNNYNNNQHNAAYSSSYPATPATPGGRDGDAPFTADPSMIADHDDEGDHEEEGNNGRGMHDDVEELTYTPPMQIGESSLGSLHGGLGGGTGELPARGIEGGTGGAGGEEQPEDQFFLNLSQFGESTMMIDTQQQLLLHEHEVGREEGEEGLQQHSSILLSPPPLPPVTAAAAADKDYADLGGELLLSPDPAPIALPSAAAAVNKSEEIRLEIPQAEPWRVLPPEQTITPTKVRGGGYATGGMLDTEHLNDPELEAPIYHHPYDVTAVKQHSSVSFVVDDDGGDHKHDDDRSLPNALNRQYMSTPSFGGITGDDDDDDDQEEDDGKEEDGKEAEKEGEEKGDEKEKKERYLRESSSPEESAVVTHVAPPVKEPLVVDQPINDEDLLALALLSEEEEVADPIEQEGKTSLEEMKAADDEQAKQMEEAKEHIHYVEKGKEEVVEAAVKDSSSDGIVVAEEDKEVEKSPINKPADILTSTTTAATTPAIPAAPTVVSNQELAVIPPPSSSSTKSAWSASASVSSPSTRSTSLKKVASSSRIINVHRLSMDFQRPRLQKMLILLENLPPLYPFALTICHDPRYQVKLYINEKRIESKETIRSDEKNALMVDERNTVKEIFLAFCQRGAGYPRFRVLLELYTILDNGTGGAGAGGHGHGHAAPSMPAVIEGSYEGTGGEDGHSSRASKASVKVNQSSKKQPIKLSDEPAFRANLDALAINEIVESQGEWMNFEEEATGTETAAGGGNGGGGGGLMSNSGESGVQEGGGQQHMLASQSFDLSDQVVNTSGKSFLVLNKDGATIQQKQQQTIAHKAANGCKIRGSTMRFDHVISYVIQLAEAYLHWTMQSLLLHAAMVHMIADTIQEIKDHQRSKQAAADVADTAQPEHPIWSEDMIDFLCNGRALFIESIHKIHELEESIGREIECFDFDLRRMLDYIDPKLSLAEAQLKQYTAKLRSKSMGEETINEYAEVVLSSSLQTVANSIHSFFSTRTIHLPTEKVPTQTSASVGTVTATATAEEAEAEAAAIAAAATEAAAASIDFMSMAKEQWSTWSEKFNRCLLDLIHTLHVTELLVKEPETVKRIHESCQLALESTVELLQKYDWFAYWIARDSCLSMLGKKSMNNIVSKAEELMYASIFDERGSFLVPPLMSDDNDSEEDDGIGSGVASDVASGGGSGILPAGNKQQPPSKYGVAGSFGMQSGRSKKKSKGNKNRNRSSKLAASSYESYDSTPGTTPTAARGGGNISTAKLRATIAASKHDSLVAINKETVIFQSDPQKLIDLVFSYAQLQA